jgi:hypothetical protein
MNKFFEENIVPKGIVSIQDSIADQRLLPIGSNL